MRMKTTKKVVFCFVEIHDKMHIKRSWGLPPPPLGIPRCDDAVLPASRNAPNTGNTEASFTPPPPQGRAGVRGGGIS